MTALRMTFLTVSALIFAGIALTGFSRVHWLLYVPAVMMFFAGATGFCPGLRLWQKLGFR